MTFNNSLCWQVQGGTHKPSYIFGTIHQMDANKIQMPLDRLESLLDETGALCVEVDFGADNGKMDESMMGGFEADHDDIADLEPLYRERLLAILKTSDDGQALIPMLDRIPVSLVAMMITIQRQSRSAYFTEPNLEIETRFVQLANSREYPVLELESLEQQAAMITGAGETAVSSLDSLRQSIDADDDPNGIDVFARYAAQNLNLLPDKDMNAPGMVKRNKSMVRRLIDLLSEQRMLVMIGAAHRAGEHGLLEFLACEGFSVVPHRLEIGTSFRR